MKKSPATSLTTATRTTRASAAGSRATPCPPLSPTAPEERAHHWEDAADYRFLNWEEDDDDDALSSCCHVRATRNGDRDEEALSGQQEDLPGSQEDLPGHHKDTTTCCCFSCRPEEQYRSL